MEWFHVHSRCSVSVRWLESLFRAFLCETSYFRLFKKRACSGILSLWLSYSVKPCFIVFSGVKKILVLSPYVAEEYRRFFFFYFTFLLSLIFILGLCKKCPKWLLVLVHQEKQVGTCNSWKCSFSCRPQFFFHGHLGVFLGVLLPILETRWMLVIPSKVFYRPVSHSPNDRMLSLGSQV